MMSYHLHIFPWAHIYLWACMRNWQISARTGHAHKNLNSVIQLLPCLHLKLVCQKRPNVAFKNSTGACSYDIADWLKMSIFHILCAFVNILYIHILL